MCCHAYVFYVAYFMPDLTIICRIFFIITTYVTLISVIPSHSGKATNSSVFKLMCSVIYAYISYMNVLNHSIAPCA